MQHTGIYISIGILLFSVAATQVGGEILKVSLKPTGNMTQADLWSVETVKHPNAVLVLCPGYNGIGKELIEDKKWQEFAQKNNLGLVGLSFASEVDDLTSGKGYYYASKGSGQVLLDGLRKIYGRDLPILIYGFSGGAQFTSRFVEWKPDRVMSWCAYSADWWDLPLKGDKMPPGIVACGDQDTRLGASMIYFKQGRAAGKPWLWIDLQKTDHAWSSELDTFVRAYFNVILHGSKAPGVWMDIDTIRKYPGAKDIVYPSESAWLPSEDLLPLWVRIDVP